MNLRFFSRMLAPLLLVLSANSALSEPTYVRFDANVCHRPKDPKAWGLSEKQLEVLCKASYFDVTLLRKDNQFIALVGETHRTTKEGSNQATEILSEFPFRGFEQASEEVSNLVQPTIDKFVDRNKQPPVEAWMIYSFPSLGSLANLDGLSVWTYAKPEYKGKNEGKEYSDFVTTIKGPEPSKSWGHPGYFRKKVYEHFRKAHPKVSLSINLEPENKLYELRLKNRALDLCIKASESCWDSYLIDYRNFIMREVAQDILNKFPEEKGMLMIVGMNHISGLVRSFVCSNSFERHTLSRRGTFTVAQNIYELHLQYGTRGKIIVPPTESYEWPSLNCANE